MAIKLNSINWLLELGKNILARGTLYPSDEIKKASDVSFNSTIKIPSDNVQDAIEHVESKKLDISGGTMEGILIANNNEEYEISQIRNILLSKQDLEEGVSYLQSGSLYFVYEE